MQGKNVDDFSLGKMRICVNVVRSLSPLKVGEGVGEKMSCLDEILTDCL